MSISLYRRGSPGPRPRPVLALVVMVLLLAAVALLASTPHVTAADEQTPTPAAVPPQPPAEAAAAPHDGSSNDDEEAATQARLRAALVEKEEAARKSGTPDYSSVREDFACRACMALTGAFFHDVLPPAAAKYIQYAEQEARNGPASSVGRGVRKEAMVAEVHETIDGLCAVVKARHEKEAALEDAAEATAAAAGSMKPVRSGGSRRNVNQGIDIACPVTLEDLNEALTTTAFKVLMPRRFAGITAENNDGGDGEGDDGLEGGTEKGDKTAADGTYILPKAGVFCELQKLCSPYLHYHITSEETIAIKRREAAAEEKKARRLEQDREALRAALKGSKGGGDAAGKKAPAAREGAATPETGKKKSAEQAGMDAVFGKPTGAFSDKDKAAVEAARAKAKAAAAAAEGAEGRRGGSDNKKAGGPRIGGAASQEEQNAKAQLRYLLTHPLELLTTAFTTVPMGVVLTRDFWVQGAEFLNNRAVKFHMLPQWPYVVLGVVTIMPLSILLVVLTMCCCSRCQRSGGAAVAANTNKADLAAVRPAARPGGQGAKGILSPAAAAGSPLSKKKKN